MTELAAGAVVGRKYRLERELTRGGMGIVWVASHLVTKRNVAIKVLKTTGTDPAARARLMREARVSCAVDHPSVVPVLDVIEADGAPALVMDLLEGESLRARLDREKKLDAAEACRLLAPVAEALAAAHAANIVHRDVKPENVFLEESQGKRAVRVLDFGVAKLVATEETTSSLTESGAMLGTPYYMAPEQAFGERDVGPAVDAWALGIVLHECISGERPTQADNLGQVIKRITSAPIPPLEGISDALAALLARLLERDREKRETDMKKVASSLARFGSISAGDDAQAISFRPATIVKIAAAVLVVGSLGVFFGARQTEQRKGLVPPPMAMTARPEPTHAAVHASARPSTPVVTASVAPSSTTPPITTMTARVSPSASQVPPSPPPKPSETVGPGRVIVNPPF